MKNAHISDVSRENANLAALGIPEAGASRADGKEGVSGSSPEEGFP
jgi:hypothetical protein